MFDRGLRDFVYSFKELSPRGLFSFAFNLNLYPNHTPHIMSDEKQPPKPPAPMKKTSAVPLKKETVRVTLKADSASPEAKATAPSAPAAPKPPAPAPTIPLKTAPVATAPAAPKPAGAPAPAPTIPLKTAPAAGVAETKPLPQATVQLQSTQQLGAPTAPTSPQIGTINTTDMDDEEENDTIPTVMSILAFVLALGVLVVGLMTWMEENEVGDLFG